MLSIADNQTRTALAKPRFTGGAFRVRRTNTHPRRPKYGNHDHEPAWTAWGQAPIRILATLTAMRTWKACLSCRIPVGIAKKAALQPFRPCGSPAALTPSDGGKPRLTTGADTKSPAFWEGAPTADAVFFSGRITPCWRARDKGGKAFSRQAPSTLGQCRKAKCLMENVLTRRRRISVFVAGTGLAMAKRNRSAWTSAWRLRVAP